MILFTIPTKKRKKEKKRVYIMFLCMLYNIQEEDW